jgi:lysophospholipase L1-like esterase
MRKILLGSLLLLSLLCACTACVFWAMGKPSFWGFQISAYEKADRVNPPKAGVIVFTGGSSIRFWDTLANDMKPLEVINRGFGGSQIAHVNQYASRIIIPYRPRAVVLYAGDNDLSWPWSKPPEQVFGDFRQFVGIIHSQLPETWVYYVSIKPSILRSGNWQKMKKTNELIAAYISTQPRVQFIDVDEAMLDAQGKPRAELFRWDGLHMNAKGYAVWTSIIKPVLLSRFEGMNSPRK